MVSMLFRVQTVCALLHDHLNNFQIFFETENLKAWESIPAGAKEEYVFTCW
jgi:hypothetical protein